MFQLPRLPYSYDALEPYVDARTMEIHLTKHHQAYVDNLNQALQGYPDLQCKSLEDLLLHIDQLPKSIATAVKNNGGGHYNHTFFWQVMRPQGFSLKGPLLQALVAQYGSFELFQEKFEQAARAQFGSGWAWLVVHADGTLAIVATSNQDIAFSAVIKPILILDVWEHAYYLHYQNRRLDYIKAWWHVVDWQKVQELYLQARSK